MANTDDPKKDNTVNFITDIIPAFGQKVEESKQTQLKIKQRSIRSFSKSQDRGRAVMFTYTKPKGYVDNTLEYHHKFPVSIILDVDSEYITGINPFYIPPKTRKIIISQLLSMVDNKTQPTPESRAIITYAMIERTSIGKFVKPAIKKYLKSRMSQFAVQYSPALWGDVFIGKTSKQLESLWSRTSKSIVYGDYVRRINN